MLYVIHGTDSKKIVHETRTLVDNLLSKRPDSMLFEYDVSSFDATALEEHCGGQGLFEEKYIVVLRDISEDNEKMKLVLDRLEDLATSKNVFIVRERKLNARFLKKFEKHALKVVQFGADTKKENEFNVFALADAVRERNRKRAWTIYQKALKAGKTPEELSGIISWQLKSLVLVAKSKNAKESGLKPFVYNKTKQSVGKFSKGEPQRLLWNMVENYHEARRGNGDLQTHLEAFLLKI